MHGEPDELKQVFVVGHDWGAIIAWYLCLFRPDRVTALVNTSVAFMRHVFIRAGASAVKPTDYFCRNYGPTYYICRFQVCTTCVLHRNNFDISYLLYLSTLSQNKILNFYSAGYVATTITVIS
jgi:pimeloyl-ACP methyl ester carboxylesterase